MNADLYNVKHLLSPQKKPLAGTLLKTYSHRPNSALRTNYEPELVSPSQSTPESKKKSLATKIATPSASTRTADNRSHIYRRKPEESSTSMSKSSSKWDKQLSIETSGSAVNNSLKGYSVTSMNNQNSILSKSSTLFASPLASKYGIYSQTPMVGNYKASNSSNGKVTPLKKPSNTKANTLNISSNGKLYHGDVSSKESGYTNVYASPKRILPYEEEETPYIPPFDPTKCSIKQNGVIKAYAVNTHQGIVRNYNEDRVAIILNIMRPPHMASSEEWPSCSFFGVYDGHGGTACADFLRDNLHQFVIQDKNFPKNPAEALRKGFEEAEKAFREVAHQISRTDIDRSGSCAIVALIVEDMCYIANVGDSRAIASIDHGRKIVPLSRDHKPNDKDEQKRILSFGGKIYQSQITQPPGFPGPKVLIGPHRVFPGRLSVSRTFGDLEAKLPKLGGNPYVVIAEPEIKSFKITKEWDFIILASDGIYDKLENNDVINSIWHSTTVKEGDVHKQSAMAVEGLMKESLMRKTLDNITVTMVTFSGFERANFGIETPKDLEKSVEMNNKSLLNNSGYLNNPYPSPGSHKTSAISPSNERNIVSSSTYKRSANKPSIDYQNSYHLDKSNWSGSKK